MTLAVIFSHILLQPKLVESVLVFTNLHVIISLHNQLFSHFAWPQFLEQGQNAGVHACYIGYMIKYPDTCIYNNYHWTVLKFSILHFQFTAS